MIKKSYYAIIPSSVRYDVRLKPNAKLLFGELTALSNEKGYCWAGNEYFASLYEVTHRTISAWIAQLAECGYISIQLQYREGTKQVEYRFISITTPPEEKFHTPRKNLHDPIEEKFHTPQKKSSRLILHSNTTINNTSNIGETSSPVLSKGKFVAPSLNEVIDYCNSTNAGIDPAGFWHFYDSKGWMVGKNKMQKWRSAVGTWKSSNRAKQQVGTDSIRGTSLQQELTDTSWAH